MYTGRRGYNSFCMTKRSNEDWLSDLRSDGERRENALGDLRAVVVSGLPYALSKWLSPVDPRFEPLAEEVAQETLLRVMDNLDSFEGRSQFTTWVHKIAVRIALTELRRKRWENVSLDDDSRESGLALVDMLVAPEPDPERSAEAIGMIEILRRILLEELTEKQQQAMVAIAIQGMPMEEVARRLGTNRNALYKVMHDARLRLKNRLAMEGLSPEDVLGAFEEK